MANVGDTIVFGGIECVVAYKADTEQSWGQYILCEKHDLNYYEPDLGTGGVNEDYTGKPWGFYGTYTGVKDTAIGTGKDNTDQLITQNNNNSDTIWYYVNQHRSDTGKQWHVPSKDELNVLYENLTQIGNFSTSTRPWYWSSSEDTSLYAWNQDFYDGDQISPPKNTTVRRVRCVAYATEADLPFTETIQITSTDPDAQFRYTTDGSDPTISSSLYEGQFEVTPPATVKARAYVAGRFRSDVSSLEVEIPADVIGYGETVIGYGDYVIGYQKNQ